MTCGTLIAISKEKKKHVLNLSWAFLRETLELGWLYGRL